jgi:hypothetical protein
MPAWCADRRASVPSIPQASISDLILSGFILARKMSIQ